MEPAARIGLDLLLTTIVVPMATVVVVAAVGLRLGRPLGGLALVAGALTGAAAVVGWPLPPVEAHHWIPLGACGAALGVSPWTDWPRAPKDAPASVGSAP